MIDEPETGKTADANDIMIDESDLITPDRFDRISRIERHSYGELYKVRERGTNELLALYKADKLKILERDDKPKIENKLKLMPRLSHPFFVSLRYAFQTHKNIYLAYNYVDGQELFFHLQKLRCFTLEAARFLIAEICIVVEYLHSEGIIHRDIKPEEFHLTPEGHIMLIGCGLFKQEPDRTSTFCGTPEYLAPEILLGQSYGQAVDWWAVGNVLFEMLTGLPPFYSADVQEMYCNIMKATLFVPERLGKDTSALLHKFLTRDPKKRLQSLDKIKAEPFFAGTDWDALFNKTATPPYSPPREPDQTLSPAFSQTTPPPTQEKLDDTKYEMWSNFYYDYRFGLYGWSPELHKKLHLRVQRRAITFLLVHHRYITDKTHSDHPLSQFGSYLVLAILHWINPPPHIV